IADVSAFDSLRKTASGRYPRAARIARQKNRGVARAMWNPRRESAKNPLRIRQGGRRNLYTTGQTRAHQARTSDEDYNPRGDRDSDRRGNDRPPGYRARRPRRISVT